MNKIIVTVGVFVLCIVSIAAQFPNQFPNQNPNFNGFPQTPNINDLCSQPGSNCNINSRFAEDSSFTDYKGNTHKYHRACDERGCYERRIANGSSLPTMSLLLLITTTIFVSVKNLLL